MVRSTKRTARRVGSLPLGSADLEPIAGGDRPPYTRILIVADDTDRCARLVRLLAAHGTVEFASTNEAVMNAAHQRQPDLVVVDLGSLQQARELACDLRRDMRMAQTGILLLSSPERDNATPADSRPGPDCVLARDVDDDTLLTQLSECVGLARYRRGALQELRRSEVRLTSAIDLLGLSLYARVPGSDAFECDDRFRAMWGVHDGAPFDMTVLLSALHPEDRPQVEATMAARLDSTSERLPPLEYRVIGIEDQVERWVSSQALAVFEDGRPVAVFGVALDITLRKRAEAQLRRSEERFRMYAENSTDVLWILDAQRMQLDYLSPAFESIWGEAPRAMLADLNRWTQSIHPEDRARALEALDRVLQGEAVVRAYRILRPDGTTRSIRDSSFPIRDAQGQVRHVGGIAEDVTRQRALHAYVVDPDEERRQRLGFALKAAGYHSSLFASGRSFLEVAPALIPGCVILHLDASGADRLAVPRELKARGIALPVIIAGGASGDVTSAVQAMKVGAKDWLEAPYDLAELMAAIASASADALETVQVDARTETARARIAGMSARERDVLAGLISGGTNKVIARELGISPRTVEVHRGRIMERLGVHTLPEAVLLAAAAGVAPFSGAPRPTDV
jgi:PAS domain S-box-containing protein